MRRRHLACIELSGLFWPSPSWRSTDTAWCACLTTPHAWLVHVSIDGSWTAELLTMAPVTGESLDLQGYILSD